MMPIITNIVFLIHLLQKYTDVLYLNIVYVKSDFYLFKGNYSLLNATTGSFLDAALAGINPPIKVNIIARIIKITA